MARRAQTPDRPIDTRALVETLRALLTFAEAAGAPADLVAAIADGMLQAFAELEGRRRGDFDPRRRKSMWVGARLAAARRAGASIPELCERFGLKRRQIYRLMRMCPEIKTHIRDFIGRST